MATLIVSDDPNWNMYNIITEQGTTLSRTFIYKDSAGAIVNLTGYTAAMKVRKLYPATSLQAAHADAAIISIATGGSGITITGAAGQVDIVVSASTLAACAAGTYSYDLEVTSGSGVVTKIARGLFDIRSEATF